MDYYWFNILTQKHVITWTYWNERWFNIYKLHKDTWTEYDPDWYDIDWYKFWQNKKAIEEEIESENRKFWIYEIVEISDFDNFWDDSFTEWIANELWVSKLLVSELIITMRDIIISWLKKYWIVKIRWFWTFKVIKNSDNKTLIYSASSMFDNNDKAVLDSIAAELIKMWIKR